MTNWDAKRVPLINYNAEQSMRTMSQMESFIKAIGAKLWINHDPDQSATIPKSPALSNRTSRKNRQMTIIPPVRPVRTPGSVRVSIIAAELGKSFRKPLRRRIPRPPAEFTRCR